jgi:hypothetical protein
MKMHPVLDTKPQIFYDTLKKKYVLWKDPRLPKIFPFGGVSTITRRVVQECKMTKIENG